MATYNGHKNYNHWNVSLWINNDEGLYKMAQRHVRRNVGNRNNAASAMLDELCERGMTHTDDSVKFTVSAIRAAMVGM